MIVFAVSGCCGNTSQEQNLSDCDSCVLVSEYHVPSRFTFHEFYLKKGDSISALHIKLQVKSEESSFTLKLVNHGGSYRKRNYFLLSESESIHVIEQVIDSALNIYGCPQKIHFDYMIYDWSDHAIETTVGYAKKHPNWQEEGIMLREDDITNSIKETSMYKSIADALQKKGFTMMEEKRPLIYHPYFTSMDDTLTILNRSLPPCNYVIGGYVVLSSSRDTTIDNGYEPMRAEPGNLTKLINKLLK